MPLPGHPEMPLSGRYQLTADGVDVEVRAERFDFDVAMFTLGEAEIEVAITVAESFSSYTLKPSRHGLNVTRSGNTLKFQLNQPHKLVLQIPGRTPLAIIVTPTEVDAPTVDDPDVIYFEPGIHDVGVIQPESGQTIYFASGALVKGRIQAEGVRDVTVCGRGFLETEGYSTRENRQCGILFEHCHNVRLEGIALRSYHTWWQMLFLNTIDATVEQVNLFGVGVNTDGVDIDAVKDFVVRDSFIRAEDDGLGWHAVDAEANGEMITERALADNIVIWNTRYGNGVRIGASMEAQLWRDITLRNLDILEHGGAGLYSDYCDWAWMQDLRFENVTIEKPTRPIEFKIEDNRYANSTGFLDERGHYEGLLFENVIAAGGVILLHGYDATHRIDTVRLNNCVVGGEAITSVDQLDVNAYVTDIAFNEPLPERQSPSAGSYQFDALESRTNQKAQYIADMPSASNGRVRVFVPTEIGDYIEHEVDAAMAGAYQLKMRVWKGPKSGQAQLSINGAPVGEVIDFYAEDNSLVEYEFGEIELPEGPKVLRFCITGKSDGSSGMKLGLDSMVFLSPLEQ